MPENNNNEEKPYRSILNDDNGTAQPIRRKKKDPMEKVRREIEEQQRQQREKAELLKLRQGIIEESEEIPEDEPPKYEKPKGWKAVENFFYHYKWRLIGSIFAVALISFMVVQTVTRQKNDLYVLIIANSSSDGFYAKTADIEVALERYCPDFDGNGYVHVGVNYIDLSSKGGMSEYSDAQLDKFSAELFTGDSQLFLSDRQIINLINSYTDTSDNVAEEVTEESATAEVPMHSEFFRDLSEEFPDAVLYQNVGVQLNSTGFTDQAKWKSCPDTIGLYLRNEFQTDMTGNSDRAKEQRRRAEIVLDNIVKNNVVNPDWQGD